MEYYHLAHVPELIDAITQFWEQDGEQIVHEAVPIDRFPLFVQREFRPQLANIHACGDFTALGQLHDAFDDFWDNQGAVHG